MWSSLVSLGVFLVGSLHHFLEAVALFLEIIYKIVKAVCYRKPIKPVFDSRTLTLKKHNGALQKNELPDNLKIRDEQ